MHPPCQTVYDACADAIAWIDANRHLASALDRESESLKLRCIRARNKAKRLANSVERPFATGFFGMSQAGKSYLISTLAANQHGKLDIRVGTDRLNFLLHINPPGAGREATGLVTRFTQRKATSPEGYPLHLSLFSEADLIKVFGNAFFNNFDRAYTQLNTSEADLSAHLQTLEHRRLREPQPGLDADAVIEVQDYFEQRFGHSHAGLKTLFWPTAMTLAAHLHTVDRAELFSILWNQVPALTATFKLLIDALRMMQFAPAVYCEIAALVQRTGDDWLASDSIINVDALQHLEDAHNSLNVRPVVVGTTASDPVRVPRALLAALTAEVELTLADASNMTVLEQIDLLDFPGYRGHLSIKNLDEPGQVAQLVLRGKVEYLFERYTEHHEMNTLVMCTPSNQQSDANGLGPVLQTWVNTIQGDNPQTRRARGAPRLLWAVTKFDQRLDVTSEHSKEMLCRGWEGMIKLTLLEHFGVYDWLTEWTPGQAFNNLFPVRKPGKAGAVIITNDEQESGLQPGQVARLSLLKETFCDHAAVNRHIHNPSAAWDAMLTFNDGGVLRLTQHLAKLNDGKNTRPAWIAAQIKQLATDLADRLQPYYSSGTAGNTALKKKIVGGIVTKFYHPKKTVNKLHLIGDLIHLLQPSRALLHALYLRAEADPEPEATTNTTPANDEDDADIDLDELLAPSHSIGAQDQSTQTLADRSARFARVAISAWITQLKDLAEKAHIQRYFGLNRTHFDNMMDELIIGADRHGLEHLMTQALRVNEHHVVTQEKIAWRQADLVFSVFARFIDYLEASPFSSAPSAPAADLFKPVPLILPGQLPTLQADPAPYAEHFGLDWLRALRALVTNNADYATEQTISPAQNLRLGDIIHALRNAV